MVKSCIEKHFFLTKNNPIRDVKDCAPPKWSKMQVATVQIDKKIGSMDADYHKKWNEKVTNKLSL